MQQTIILSLSEDYRVTPDNTRLARQNDSGAAIMKVTLNEAQTEKQLFLDIELPDGTKARTARILPDSDGIASYTIPAAVTAEKGLVRMQLVFEDTEGFVRKSDIFGLFVCESINAEDEIADEVSGFMAAAQDALDSVEEIISAYEGGELNGVTAYDAAIQGGYTGTEAEFNAKLAAAEANVIETVKVNGVALTPTNKAVDITVPQNTISGSNVSAVCALSQSDYDDIESPSAQTLYIIVEEE